MNNNIYDNLWKTGWEDARLYGPIARHSRRIIKKMIKSLKISSVLDVGCGEGSLLNLISEIHNPEIISGIDVSHNALEIAKKVFPDGNFYKIDITKQKLEKNFDLIVSADVIEHLKDDEKALMNMAKMLNPNGRLIISTLLGTMRDAEKKVGHLRNYNKTQLTKIIKNTGLEIESVITWGWPIYSPLYRNFLNIIQNKGTMGKFGLARKLLCHILYFIFYLNSAKRGDYIFIKAKKL